MHALASTYDYEWRYRFLANFPPYIYRRLFDALYSFRRSLCRQASATLEVGLKHVDESFFAVNICIGCRAAAFMAGDMALLGLIRDIGLGQFAMPDGRF